MKFLFCHLSPAWIRTDKKELEWTSFFVDGESKLNAIWPKLSGLFFLCLFSFFPPFFFLYTKLDSSSKISAWLKTRSASINVPSVCCVKLLNKEWKQAMAPHLHGNIFLNTYSLDSNCGTGWIVNYYQDQNNAPLQFQIARTGAVILVCPARYL